MQLIKQRELNLEQQAKLFALLSIGQADAAIVAWDNKYHFDVTQPIFPVTRFSVLAHAILLLHL